MATVIYNGSVKRVCAKKNYFFFVLAPFLEMSLIDLMRVCVCVSTAVWCVCVKTKHSATEKSKKKKKKKSFELMPECG